MAAFESGRIAAEVLRGHTVAILVVGEVADVVEAGLDLPMAAVGGEGLAQRRPFRPQQGDAVDGLGGRLPPK